VGELGGAQRKIEKIGDGLAILTAISALIGESGNSGWRG
jgi:hypothetical protein